MKKEDLYSLHGEDCVIFLSNAKTIEEMYDKGFYEILCRPLEHTNNEYTGWCFLTEKGRDEYRKQNIEPNRMNLLSIDFLYDSINDYVKTNGLEKSINIFISRFKKFKLLNSGKSELTLSGKDLRFIEKHVMDYINFGREKDGESMVDHYKRCEKEWHPLIRKARQSYVYL